MAEIRQCRTSNLRVSKQQLYALCRLWMYFSANLRENIKTRYVIKERNPPPKIGWLLPTGYALCDVLKTIDVRFLLMRYARGFVV